MKKTSKHYAAEEKAKIVIEVLKGEYTLAELSSKYGVHANQLQRWKQSALEAISDKFKRKSKDFKKVITKRQLIIKKMMKAIMKSQAVKMLQHQKNLLLQEVEKRLPLLRILKLEVRILMPLTLKVSKFMMSP